MYQAAKEQGQGRRLSSLGFFFLLLVCCFFLKYFKQMKLLINAIQRTLSSLLKSANGENV